MAFPSQTRPDSLSQSATARARALALAGIVGPIWFTTLVVLQGFLQPDYSHVRLPISALGAADWLDSKPQFLRHRCTRDGVCAGLAPRRAPAKGSALDIPAEPSAGYLYLLARSARPTPRGRSGIVLLVISGIGIVLAGLFPWKMVDGVPTETPPHVIGAITAFAAAGLGLIVFSRRMTADPQWRDLATYTMKHRDRSARAIHRGRILCRR